jgi:uncharacterized protein RhaS with RHS repeats
MYLSQDPIGLAGGVMNLYSYVPDTNGWVDIFGLSGNGGAYIFDVTATHSNGNKTTETYIGKGQVRRMQESQRERMAKMQNKYSDSEIKVVASSHSDTGYNNELGKMVENRLMYNAGFRKGKKIPSGYFNSIMSGNTAWENNSDLQNEAERIANEMEEDMNMQRREANETCQEQ